jgi:SH3 domain protein
MKKYPLLVLFSLLFLLSTAQAATWYVKPSAEIPLRRGQGTGYKIIAVLADGTPVTLLSEGNKWVRVRLESGKEGWILKRYLSREKPYKDQIADLEAKNATLRQELDATKGQLTELTDLHQKTARELSACIAERDTIRNDFEQLEQDTRDVVATKNELHQARQQLEQLKKRLTALELENTGLKKSSAMMWFLTGSGVLLLGMMIGLITGKRNKRRRSSLL